MSVANRVFVEKLDVVCARPEVSNLIEDEDISMADYLAMIAGMEEMVVSDPPLIKAPETIKCTVRVTKVPDDELVLSENVVRVACEFRPLDCLADSKMASYIKKVGNDFVVEVLPEKGRREPVEFIGSEIFAIIGTSLEMPDDPWDRLVWLSKALSLPPPCYRGSMSASGVVMTVTMGSLSATSNAEGTLQDKLDSAKMKLSQIAHTKVVFLGDVPSFTGRPDVVVTTQFPDSILAKTTKRWTLSDSDGSIVADIGLEKPMVDLFSSYLVRKEVFKYEPLHPEVDTVCHEVRQAMIRLTDNDLTRWLFYRKRQTERVKYEFIKGNDVHDHKLSPGDACDCDLHVTLVGHVFRHKKRFRIPRVLLGKTLSIETMMRIFTHSVKKYWLMCDYKLGFNIFHYDIWRRAMMCERIGTIQLAARCREILYNLVTLIEFAPDFTANEIVVFPGHLISSAEQVNIPKDIVLVDFEEVNIAGDKYNFLGYDDELIATVDVRSYQPSHIVAPLGGSPGLVWVIDWIEYLMLARLF